MQTESKSGSGAEGNETADCRSLASEDTNAENGLAASGRLGRPSPVFIVGSPRSGTSALVDALFAGGYHGFREGNLLGLLGNINDTIGHYFASVDTGSPSTLITQFTANDFRDSIRDLVCGLVAKNNPQNPWLDKTGNVPMLKALPELVGYWPTSRIIFAKRRGLENIASRLVKFPGLGFGRHCADWALTMRTWRQVRERLEPWRYVEVDQQNMVSQPDETANVLAEFLRLGSEERLAVERTFRSGRPQQTAPGTAERRLALDETGWTEEQRKQFVTVCGPEMTEYGYSLD